MKYSYTVRAVHSEKSQLEGFEALLDLSKQFYKAVISPTFSTRKQVKNKKKMRHDFIQTLAQYCTRNKCSSEGASICSTNKSQQLPQYSMRRRQSKKLAYYDKEQFYCKICTFLFSISKPLHRSKLSPFDHISPANNPKATNKYNISN